LVRGPLTPADASTISPQAKVMSELRLTVAPNAGAFPGPSTKDAVFFPGFDGGIEWGGAAADDRGIYYVNVNEIPWAYQMVAARRPDGSPLSLGERTYVIQCGSCHGFDQKGEAGSGIPPLEGLAQRRTKEAVLQLVEAGTGGRMPAFRTLAEGQRRAVVDFLFGNELPAAAYAAPGRAGGGAPGGPAGAANAADEIPYAFRGFQRWFDHEGYPAIKPPWGTLNAVDLNTGTIKWKVPLGEYPALTARGIPPTGTENYGGPAVTATGVLFQAGTGDDMIRAFDSTTGKELWKAKLPFAGFATPSIYAVGGKQYVVISAAGTKSGRPSGGSLVAFALAD
jgi:quinoprotein glucose dehydrogenase